MVQSNIFAYIELSKMVQELDRAKSPEDLKKKLRSQSAYFKIIEPRYFSESLEKEWILILAFTTYKDVQRDLKGRIICCSIRNSIDSLTVSECKMLTNRIFKVYNKIKEEFN